MSDTYRQWLHQYLSEANEKFYMYRKHPSLRYYYTGMIDAIEAAINAESDCLIIDAVKSFPDNSCSAD